MASKVNNVLKLIGRRAKGIGDAIPHAMDGAYDGGMTTKNQRHKAKKALHKQRLRPSGMTDDMYGSKEVGGTQENPYEAE